MRPTSFTPKIPKVFPESLRNSVQPKSLYGTLLTLAEMLGPRGDGGALLTDVDRVLAGNPSYRRGITHPITRGARAGM